MTALVLFAILALIFYIVKKLSILNTAGYEDTVIWNPYGNEGMGFNNFVCVESVKVRKLFLGLLLENYFVSSFL